MFTPRLVTTDMYRPYRPIKVNISPRRWAGRNNTHGQVQWKDLDLSGRISNGIDSGSFGTSKFSPCVLPINIHMEIRQNLYAQLSLGQQQLFMGELKDFWKFGGFC